MAVNELTSLGKKDRIREAFIDKLCIEYDNGCLTISRIPLYLALGARLRSAGDFSMQNKSFKVVSVSAVLVANQHNPTIVNPDFLKDKGIVKPKWKAEDDGCHRCTGADYV